MTLLATLLLVLGVAGLLVPILPGIPLLLAAALLFAANRPALRRRLLGQSRLRFERSLAVWENGLAAWQRCKLRALVAVRWLLGKSRRGAG